LPFAVIVSIDEPVAHIIVLASGLAGNEIVMPVIRYGCANNCTELIINKRESVSFIKNSIKE
jgi:hypothetical protein